MCSTGSHDSRTVRVVSMETPGISDPVIAEQARLMARIAQGDAVVYRQVVDMHLRTIVNFAYRMLSDSSEAQDVAQETLLRLWKVAPQWKPQARITTWLHQVASNLCIDKLRNKARGHQPLDAPRIERSVDPAPQAHAQLERHERQQAVRDALGGLPERQKIAMILVYYQGLSNREAAQVMQVQVDALESLLSRGRRALRSRLAAFAAKDSTV